VAKLFGLNPMFGVLAGSATLTGGPATGLAFAPLFEKAGLAGAESLAVTAAMAGIICGGLVGGPVITVLMQRFKVQHPNKKVTEAEQLAEESVVVRYPSESAREFDALKSIVVLLMAMWLGVWVGKGFEGIGLTLPTYIGAMLVGAVIRNVDDYTGWVKLSVPTTDLIGNICLALFLAIALMDLKLWELAGMGLPLLVNLIIQVAVVALFAVPIYWLMGRDYDAAVMGGGFIGFMLGTTANAMAVMRRLAQRYGPAPRAFLVAPLVGAFFIDFINALIITGFLNFWPH
jgi:ESS family glutamate:Na+ symporter